MCRTLTGLLLSLLAVAMPALGDPRLIHDASNPLVAFDPVLRSSLDRIASGSSLWRSAVEALRGRGRRALVLTPDQVTVQPHPEADRRHPFEPDLLAEVTPLPATDEQVQTVLVVVNVPLLRRLYDEQPWSWQSDLARDLDRIVIHEVYGHAVPYLMAGNLSGHCPDPLPGTRATDACAIQRENAVRDELKLGLRRDAGLGGLTLARRLSMWPDGFGSR